MSPGGEPSKPPKFKALFKTVKVRLAEDDNPTKKFVAYTIQVRRIVIFPSGRFLPDVFPINVERRYTDFLHLYLFLRKEFPEQMKSIHFPRKVYFGNFDNSVVISRQIEFEKFLCHIASSETLCQSKRFALFLIGDELFAAHYYTTMSEYSLATVDMEKIFRILSKFYASHHPLVICALCILVACNAADEDPDTSELSTNDAVTFAEIALCRFEGICDMDLLKYYIPLLHLCVDLFHSVGKETKPLTDRIEHYKSQGIRVEGIPSILDQLDEIYQQMFVALKMCPSPSATTMAV